MAKPSKPFGEEDKACEERCGYLDPLYRISFACNSQPCIDQQGIGEKDFTCRNNRYMELRYGGFETALGGSKSPDTKLHGAAIWRI